MVWELQTLPAWSSHGDMVFSSSRPSASVVALSLCLVSQQRCPNLLRRGEQIWGDHGRALGWTFLYNRPSSRTVPRSPRMFLSQPELDGFADVSPCLCPSAHCCGRGGFGSPHQGLAGLQVTALGQNDNGTDYPFIPKLCFLFWKVPK